VVIEKNKEEPSKMDSTTDGEKIERRRREKGGRRMIYQAQSHHHP
jgi:hypothetical protein